MNKYFSYSVKCMKRFTLLFMNSNPFFIGFLFLILFLITPFVGESWLSLVIEMLIMAIAATAANLMAGYSGMVSLGVAGFYGAGAYFCALLIKKAGFSFYIAFLSGPIIAAIIAVPIGWFCVRRTEIYFAMLSLAFSQFLFVIAFTWYDFTGGDDGIVGIPIPDFLFSTYTYYYFTLVCFIVSLIIMKTVVNSPFGKAIQAMRDNPERTGFIGIDIKKYQLITFIISSFFLGIAGSLYAGFNQNVFPYYLHWTKTFDITIVYLLGGIYTFIGPTIGAIVFVFANKILTQITEYWTFFLGLLIVLCTIYLPNGVFGTILLKVNEYQQSKKEGNRKIDFKA